MKSSRALVTLILLAVLSLGLAPLPPGAPVYLPFLTKAQESQERTANDWVPEYMGEFQYGLNPGYFGNGWTDKQVFELCYQAGCRSGRMSLPDQFLAQWGAGIRVPEFTYATRDLQFKELTVFVGQPRAEWQDTSVYAGKQSKLWQGMYEPIWDNGENGTPVNDANRFAVYMWTVVNTYGPYIQFYEIINEPDYTSSSHGWEPAGTPGSWWDGAPQPQDLPNLNAPVYNYIRLLRIAYAVVKRYDANAYVTPGGLGYASFLDVLLRYTDNPDGGQVSAEFPLTGGAYFDALSIHNYPQYGTRYWDGKRWVPDRHSDKALQVVLDAKAKMETQLQEYGYDGETYPEKVMLITEVNIARRSIDGMIGGIDVQRNFTIKMLVKAQQHELRQLYWFLTGETMNYDDPNAGVYNLMGFYENLKRDRPGAQKMTQQGIANRTTFEQLYGWTFDAGATTALDLPPTVDGAAFRRGDAVRYVLWTRTLLDLDETATATLNLPGSYTAVDWQGQSTVVSGTGLALTGAPIFLTPR